VDEFWRIVLAPAQNLEILDFIAVPGGTEAFMLENGAEACGSIPAIGSSSWPFKADNL